MVLVMEEQGKALKSVYDAIIIGKSAGGLTAATAAKSMYPEKAVLVVDKEDISMILCGIPYIFGTFDSIDDNRLPAEKGLESSGIGQVAPLAQSTDNISQLYNLTTCS